MNQLQSKENHPVLALTMGDPNGIGAEVMLKALDQLSPFRNWKPLIFGDFRVLEKVRKNLGLDLDLLKKDPETVPETQQEMENPDSGFGFRRTFKRMAAWNMQSLGRGIRVPIFKHGHSMDTARPCRCDCNCPAEQGSLEKSWP